MKQLILLTITGLLSLGSFAQGKSQGKGNGNAKAKTLKNSRQYNKNANAGTKGQNGQDDVYVPGQNQNTNTVGKTSKNQPAKVSAAFRNDYPNASGVTWNKYKGDWTATFNSGWGRSTAVYHANGERRDTRTPITRSQLPGTIWDQIFKRDNLVPVNYTQIQSPSLSSEIFRIASQRSGKMQYLFYDANGQRVNYNY